jgi:hypothetical protein
LHNELPEKWITGNSSAVAGCRSFRGRLWRGGYGDRTPCQRIRTFKRRSAKNTLRLPDLDHSKTSVLQSLSSAASKRTYAFAINDFIAWYCSEPRLAFGRTVVLRYRYELEARRLAPATINLRPAAVRGWPTRLPTMVCSVPILHQASGE